MYTGLGDGAELVAKQPSMASGLLPKSGNTKELALQHQLHTWQSGHAARGKKGDQNCSPNTEYTLTPTLHPG